MALFNGQLDILWVVVVAPSDDDVFHASGDKEFALIQKTEIAGAQKWAGTIIGKTRLEGCRRGCWTPPISLGDAGAGDPNFAYLIRRTWGAGLGIDDDHLLI